MLTRTDSTDLKAIASVRRLALVEARAILEESGPEALQLRTLAARIGSGVSTLYHHFEDKNALLCALAIEGFQELEAAMRAAIASGEHLPVEAASLDYNNFMFTNLRLYALMHSEAVLGANPKVREAEQAAFRTYEESIGGGRSLAAPDQVEDLAMVGWALGRGVASIILSQGEISTAEARGIAEKVFRGFRALVEIRKNHPRP
jgi:AcrR family transcriptional regulator